MTARLARPTLLAATAVLLLCGAREARADGKKLFNSICKACHTIGGGRRVGPDLKGVTKRRSKAWLMRFIKSSQSVVKSGDATATKLFNKFKVVMPDVPYTPAQIEEVLAYIARGSSAAPATAWRAATPQEIARGRLLFQGKQRLAHGGPPCNSCHNVKNDAVIGGGVLAKDLTRVFSRMGGGSGVASILGRPPFAVMSAAYSNAPLKRDEIIALVGFLEDADRQHAFQTPRDFGVRLVVGGSGGFAILMLLYALIWLRRKQRSVNHDIYERQVRSSDLH